MKPLIPRTLPRSPRGTGLVPFLNSCLSEVTAMMKLIAGMTCTVLDSPQVPLQQPQEGSFGPSEVVPHVGKKDGFRYLMASQVIFGELG